MPVQGGVALIARDAGREGVGDDVGGDIEGQSPRAVGGPGAGQVRALGVTSRNAPVPSVACPPARRCSQLHRGPDNRSRAHSHQRRAAISPAAFEAIRRSRCDLAHRFCIQCGLAATISPRKSGMWGQWRCRVSVAVTRAHYSRAWGFAADSFVSPRRQCERRDYYFGGEP